MIPEITVDARKALAKFSPSGIPESVRNNLRRMLPQLGKDVGAILDAVLDSELKSRNRLKVTKEMVENPTNIYVRVRLTTTAAPAMLPQWLEKGTKPHEIVARNAPSLYFYWGRIGKHASFRRVMHPGTRAYGFVHSTFEAKKTDIERVIYMAVREGAQQA